MEPELNAPRTVFQELSRRLKDLESNNYHGSTAYIGDVYSGLEPLNPWLGPNKDKEIRKLKNQVAFLSQALTFYAEPGNDDDGQKAREALTLLITETFKEE